MGDLYRLLGVPRDATEAQIRKAYHSAALRCHPDKQRSGDSSLFLAIVEAFTVLANESLRASYDRDLEIRESARALDAGRQAGVDALAAREARLPDDTLEVYRQDVKEALREVRPARNSLSFEEYRNIILSALRPRD
jgi:curved DNA-binding protein CbpA